jgi:malate permease and related proteins
MIFSAIDDLLFTCNAVLPIILLILLGYFLKRIHLLPDGFWKMANKLCFRVALPVMLFYNIYNVKSIKDIANQWQIVLYSVIIILIAFIVGLICVILFSKDPKQKGVILQCVFRSNFAIIGVSLAESLANGSNEPVALAAVISAISIPLYNVLAIVSLSIFIKNEDGTSVSPKEIIIKICKNPLIIGVFTGIIFLAFRQAIPHHTEITYALVDSTNPLSEVEKIETTVYAFSIKDDLPFIYTTLTWIKNIASPLALIALGGDFVFSAIGRLKWQIIAGVVSRTILVPILGLVPLYFINKQTGWFGDNAFIYPALIALFGTPVAVSSAPMAAEMGNDDELAGQLVVWTSIISAFTLFIIVLIARMAGIF